MKVNISYAESMTFEQFKEQYEQYFTFASPSKKESEMKKVWEKAENNIKENPEGGQTVEYDSGESQTYVPDEDSIDNDDDEDADTPEKGDVPQA